jgi:hypothetical protein
VDTVATFADDLADLLEAVLRGVVGLERAARGETRANDGENDRPKNAVGSQA